MLHGGIATQAALRELAPAPRDRARRAAREDSAIISDALRGRPVRGVLEGVDDPEEQVREAHLLPRRRRQHRNGHGEGATGLL